MLNQHIETHEPVKVIADFVTRRAECQGRLEHVFRRPNAIHKGNIKARKVSLRCQRVQRQHTHIHRIEKQQIQNTGHAWYTLLTKRLVIFFRACKRFPSVMQMMKFRPLGASLLSQ